ncbi:lipase 1-like [Episyrphus balteatus]|uniref:lipase 1-like n=1 Tax=Episyrphus balteatus TaxID=286459 RepID=UPI0024867845|nr:lipase 1-like [Episyrphus balteatus]
MKVMSLRRRNALCAIILIIKSLSCVLSAEEEDYDGSLEEEEDDSGEIITRKSIREDSTLKVDKLIAKYGYESEVHQVTTEDGYILKMHRIRNSGRQPVFLQHGLVDSSAGYVVMGPNVSLAYLLADLKYDVWMGNARGNRYSRNHTTLDPDESKFWDFSWHEIGMYDLPAMIDYALATTGARRIQYIGHSQGCTAFFVMCSMRPEYNKKIISMHALAPAAYLSDTEDHPYIKAIDLYFKSVVGSSIRELFTGEFRFICSVTKETRRTCIEAIFTIAGRDEDEFNEKMFPVVLGHYPAGASAKQIKHFVQIIKTSRFAPYSYSVSKNLALYKEHLPPKYDLSKVTVPVYLYYSLNDLLVQPSNVEELFKDLGKPVSKYLVPHKEFNHMDFLWASNVRKLLYDEVIRNLRKLKSIELE